MKKAPRRSPRSHCPPHSPRLPAALLAGTQIALTEKAGKGKKARKREGTNHANTLLRPRRAITRFAIIVPIIAFRPLPVNPKNVRFPHPAAKNRRRRQASILLFNKTMIKNRYILNMCNFCRRPSSEKGDARKMSNTAKKNPCENGGGQRKRA